MYRDFVRELALPERDYLEPYLRWAPDRLRELEALARTEGLEPHADVEAIFLHRLIKDHGFRRLAWEEHFCY